MLATEPTKTLTSRRTTWRATPTATTPATTAAKLTTVSTRRSSLKRSTAEHTSPTSPPDSPELYCDFERDMCNYTRKPVYLFAWIQQDATKTKNGPQSSCSPKGSYYLSLDAAQYGSSNEAKLISQQVSRKEKCLQFCYYTSGTKKVSLEILSRSNGKEQTIWSLPNTTRSSWNRAKVVIPQASAERQIIFRGTREGRQPKGTVVALDDISSCQDGGITYDAMMTQSFVRVSTNTQPSSALTQTAAVTTSLSAATVTAQTTANTTAPPAYNISTIQECLHIPTSEDCAFSWTRGVTLVNATEFSEPQWNFSPNSSEAEGMVQSLLSPLVTSAVDTFCLSFTYRISSVVPDSIELKVVLVSGDGLSHDLFIDWQHSIDWVPKSLTVRALSTTYQVKFVTVFSQQNDSVKLKDVQFLDGTCPLTTSTESTTTSTVPSITCYFYGELCGFHHSVKSSSIFQWHTHHAGGLTVTSEFGEKPDLASVVSQELPYLGDVCLNLNVSTTSSILVQVNAIDGDGDVTPLLNINTWGDRVQLSVTFQANFPRIQLEASNPSCPGQVHITYLHIKPGPCENETDSSTYNQSSVCPPTPSTLPATTQPTTPALITTTSAPSLSTTPEAILAVQADCDFENSTCGYEITPKNPFSVSWKRKEYSKDSIIPPHDNSSYFLNALYSHFGGPTTFRSPQLSVGSGCLTFYYYVMGDITLKVFSDVDKGSLDVLWSLKGEKSPTWKLAKIPLEAKLPLNSKYYQIVLTASTPSLSLRDTATVAVDDLQFLTQGCSGSNHTTIPSVSTPSPPKELVLGDCSFDQSNDLCGYLSLNTTDFDWRQMRGRGTTFFTGPEQDHSGDGYYLAADASSPATNGTIYQLASPQLKQNCSMCFTFYYYMYGNETGTLNINLFYNDTVHNMVSIRGEQGRMWLRGQFSIRDVFTTYRIIVEGIVGEGYRGDIAVDDFTIRDGVCETNTTETTADCSLFSQLINTDTTTQPATTGQPVTWEVTADCDFVSSLCGYERSDQSSNTFSWQRSSAQDLEGPLRKGSKTLLHALVSRDGTSTSLTSPKLIAGSKCLVFYYYILGPVTLRVSSHPDKKPTQELWSYTGSEKASWAMAQIALDSSLPRNSKNYKIIFTALKQQAGIKSAALAIDNIKFLLTDCADAVTTTPLLTTNITTHLFPNVTDAYDNTTAENMTTQAASPTVTHLMSTARHPPSPSSVKVFTDKTTAKAMYSSTSGPVTASEPLDQTTSSPSSSTEGATPGSGNTGQRKIIAIVVPIAIVAVLIIVLVGLFIAYRSRRRASLNIDGEIYDDSVKVSSNSTPVYVNHTFTSDQETNLTSWDRPLE